MSEMTIINDLWEKGLSDIKRPSEFPEWQKEQMKIMFFSGASAVLRVLPLLRAECENPDEFMIHVKAMEEECLEFDRASRAAEAERLAAADGPKKKGKPHLKIIK